MGTPWLPCSERELVALVPPRVTWFLHFNLPRGTTAQRSFGGGGRWAKRFWIYPVALRFFLKMKNYSSFLNLVCLQQDHKEKQSDVIMYGSSGFGVLFSFGKVSYVRGFRY